MTSTPLRLTPVSEITARPCRPWRHMDCPACARRTCPYGGFGSDPAWRSVGKYSCSATPECGWWYGDPVTGVFYERGQ